MQVDHLTKVQLDLTAGRSREEMDLIPEPVTWSFVAGASAEGLVPFEMACHQKAPGDEFVVEIPARQPFKVFGHLYPPILDTLLTEEPVYVKAHVAAVATATSREVVQAMATATERGSSGCGGDCGCGCG